MLKRVVMILLGGVILTLAIAPVALAWTPQEIYDDYLDNGKLDREYTCKELKEVVGDATINQYGNQTIVDGIEQIYTKQCRNELPYTGFQLAMAVIVALILIGGGIALGYFARERRRQKS